MMLPLREGGGEKRTPGRLTFVSMERPQRLASLVAQAALIVLSVFVGSSCGPARDSVLLISIDSLRADELASARAGTPVAPALAGLAAQSVVYDRAVSPAPWTTPAMISVLTGMTPLAHGVQEHDRALHSDVPTLAERFRAAGYKTAAFVPAATLRPEYGFERGFETYHFENFGHHKRSSPALTSRVLHALEQWKDEPSFIWVHLWDPHYNYRPPPPWDATFRRGRKPEREDVQCLKWVEDPVEPDEAEYLAGQYEGEIRFTDESLRELLGQLDRLQLSDRTIVALIADHGEAFLEHGYLGHTNRLDEALIHVPMMLRAPRVAAAVVTRTVSTAGLGRTLLELTGLEHEDFGFHEKLPLEQSDGGREVEEGEALSDTRRRGCLTSLTSGRYKAIVELRNCSWKLFDVTSDPLERNDLAAAEPDALRELQRRMRRRLERIDDAAVPISRLDESIVKEAEQALRSIGYIGGVSDDGKKNVLCADLPRPSGVDAFGDRIGDAPCSETKARECFDTLAELTR